jgi:soluble cytochrome b562
MSWTVDSLDIQIKSSAGSAAKNINDLADALGKLNSNSKVTKITKALDSLNNSLSGMKSQQAVMSHLSALSKSLSHLASVPELTGLKSAIKELKKLPDVMGKLDTAEISQFTAKMKLLASGLAPLATQIDKIGKGFSKLPPQVSKVVTAVKRLDNANKSATKSTKDHSKALNTQSINLLATYEHLSNVIGMLHGVQDAFAKVLSDAIQWDGIQFQFGRAFGEDAEEVLAYAEKVSKALKINQQQFMESASLYGSLLKGFGVEQELVTTMGVGLAELSYDIWAAYNNRYKTLEDASEAVRSAITGEIEPIRNAGIALTEASMQEYLDSVGKAHISVEKLTEAQKSELRYAVMVNAAMNQGIIGTYAREMDTAEGAVRTLTQQLKTLGQAFGSLFIPVLKEVVPWLSAFVELVTEGIIALGKMFGINFQEITWGNAKGMAQTADGAVATADALGDAAKSAKAMKDYTMGFDELNIIKPDSGSSGAGAGAGGLGSGESLGLGIDTLWNDAILAQASTQIDEIKEKIKAYAEEHKTMLTIVGSVAGFLGFMKVLRGLNAFLGITKTIGNLKTAFAGLSKVMSKLFSGKLLELFPKSWFANFASGIKMLKNGHLSFKDFLLGITGGLKTQQILSNIANAFGTAFTKLPGLLVNAVKAIPVWGWVVSAIAAVITLAVVDYDFTDIGYKIGHALGTALKKVGGWIVEVGKGILSGIDAAWKWVKETFDINNVFELIYLMFNPTAWATKIIPKMIEIGKEVLPGLWKGIKAGWNNFWGNIGEFINGFVQGFKDALGIKSPSRVFAEIGGFVIDGLLNGIKEKVGDISSWFESNVAPKLTVEYWAKKLDGIKQGFVQKLAEIKQSAIDKWSEISKWYANNVAPKFTRDYWVDKLAGLKEGFVQTIKNMLNTGIELFNRFIGWLNEKLHFEWEPIEIMGKTVVPGGNIQLFTIPQIVGRFEDGGFLEDGLFTMNHGEIAGKFNNGKSVVANNQQIVDGIAAGVYEAVVAAMGASRSSSGQNVNVYLDGKQIYASVRKRESERGMQLIGDQLGYA